MTDEEYDKKLEQDAIDIMSEIMELDNGCVFDQEHVLEVLRKNLPFVYEKGYEVGRTQVIFEFTPKEYESFEKEAKSYVNAAFCRVKAGLEEISIEDAMQTFIDGVELGYNKAIKKLKCCGNCKKYQFNTFHQELECISNTCEWEMKEI